MGSSWYFAHNGKSCGPVTGDELMALARKGGLRPDDLVWREGMVDWVPASAVGLMPAGGIPLTPFPPPPSPPPPPPPPVTARRANEPIRNQGRQSEALQGARRRKVALASLVAILGCVLVGLIAGLMYHVNQDATDRGPAAQADSSHSKVPTRQELAPSGVVSAQHAVSPGAPVTRAASPDKPPSGDSVSAVVDKPSVPVLPAATAPSPGTPAVTPMSPPPNAPTDMPPVQVSASPAVVPAPVETRQVLFQLLEILRTPQFQVSGLIHAQRLHYRILSRLEVSPGEAGRRRVVQWVEQTWLVDADDLSRESLAAALARLRSRQYTYQVSAHGDVTDMKGPRDAAEVSPIAALGGSGFTMTSVIDLDGWREVAEWTFLRPEDGGLQRGSWTRQMIHDWGALGSWSGITEFQKLRGSSGMEKIGFRRQLTYSPPVPGETRASPLSVSGARFMATQADGELEWSTREDRVVVARERFEVTGGVTAEVLGQSVEMQMAERQLIEVRVSRERPAVANE